MADYQTIVDEIRLFLQSDDRQRTDELVQLSIQYNDACRAVNERLRRCGAHLQQDLRSEAIHLAEAAPNLLDQVALLDFPERAEWEELASLYEELRKPTPLLIEVAEELNEAYAIEQPLQKLLSRHRLLALAQAPLAKRIEVLRKLHQLDPSSTFWEDDLRDLEEARLSELDDISRTLHASADNETIHKIVAELESNEWLEKPSSRLMQRVKALGQNLQEADTRRLLDDLERELIEAYTVGDAKRAAKLVEKWRVAESSCSGVVAPSPQVEAVFAWVQDENARQGAEKAYARSVAALEQGLSNDEPVADLQQLANDVRRHGRGLPPDLEGRLLTAVAREANTQQQWRRRILAVAAVGVVVTLGIAGLGLYAAVKNTEVKRVVARLEIPVSAKNWAEARTIYDELSEDLKLNEDVQRIYKDIIAGEAAEREEKHFRQSLAEVDSLIDVGELTEADEQIKGLTPSTRADTQSIGKLQSKLKIARQKIHSAWNDQVRSLSQVIESDLQGGNVEASRTGLESLSELLKHPNASSERPQFEEQRKELLAKFNSLQESNGESRLEQQQLAALQDIFRKPPDAAVEMVDSYVSQLTGFRTAHAESEYAEDFDAALRAAPVWRAIAKWNRVIRNWDSLVPESNELLQARISECKTFLEENTKAASHAAIAECAEYLRVLEESGAFEPSREEAVISRARNYLMSSPQHANLWYVEVNTTQKKDEIQRLYFRSGDPIVLTRNDSAQVEYLVDVQGGTKRKSLLGPQIKGSVSRVPHHVIVNSILDDLQRVSATTWNPKFIVNLERVRTSDSFPDPLPKFLLLREMFKFASAGNYLLGLECKQIVQQLENVPIDEDHWLDPFHKQAGQWRKAASEVLAELPAFHTITERVAERERLLADELLTAPLVIGWLDRVGEGAWKLRSHNKIDDRMELRIIGINGSSRARWIAIQTGPDGITVQAAGAEPVRGSLVFAVQRPTSPSALGVGAK